MLCPYILYRPIYFIYLTMPTHLKEDMPAPPFTGVDQNGKQVSLEDYKGKKLALVFYSEDDSPTCTIQACNLRDNYELLKKNGFEVVAVSPDDEKSHKKFEAKFNLPYTMIADTSHTTLNAYGVFGEKELFGRNYMGVHRTTFVIDEDGIIRNIFLKPRNKYHAQEIIANY